MKKPIYLLLALAVPAAIFVFLRQCGKNEFTIPIYYQQAAEVPAGCSVKYSAPYAVADSVLSLADWKGEALLIVADSSRETLRAVKKISEEFKEDSFKVIFPSGEEAQLDRMYQCMLFLEKPWTAVLLDSERRIRGYYAPGTREETDRLTIEINILLKKY